MGQECAQARYPDETGGRDQPDQAGRSGNGRAGTAERASRAGQAPLAGSSTNTGICREVRSWYSAYGG